jgi:hypothetical protein
MGLKSTVGIEYEHETETRLIPGSWSIPNDIPRLSAAANSVSQDMLILERGGRLPEAQNDLRAARLSVIDEIKQRRVSILLRSNIASRQTRACFMFSVACDLVIFPAQPTCR